MPSRRVLQLGFLASHRGTNLQAILDACKTGRLQARPRVVISNNSDSGALQRARKMGVPAHAFEYLYPFRPPVLWTGLFWPFCRRMGSRWSALPGI